MITQKLLKELLDYNPDTGAFTWRVDRGQIVRAGTVAGNCDNGYWRIKVCDRLYYAHRLAWLYVHGRWPAEELDHKNRDRLDNRIANLRECAPSQNSANKRVYRNNSSGMRGVHQLPNGKWIAQIQVRGKKLALGTHVSAKEARQAYLDAAARLHGEFSPEAQHGQVL